MTRFCIVLCNLAAPQLKLSAESKRWVVPGNRVLATDGPATRQSGSLRPAASLTPHLLARGFWFSYSFRSSASFAGILRLAGSRYARPPRLANGEDHPANGRR